MPARPLCLGLLMISCLPHATAEMTQQVDQDGVVYYRSAPAEHEVFMYAVPDCDYCRQARKYFVQNDIDYVEYNINTSSKRHKEFRRLGGRGTPLIVVDGRIIQGFNARAIEAALK